jgi:hypothetical protein
VAFGVGLQALTSILPTLRKILGLAALDARGIGLLVAAVAATWLVAEGTARLIRRSPPLASVTEPRRFRPDAKGEPK